MSALIAVIGVMIWAYLVYLAWLDRYHREFPPEDETPDWVRAWLDEWDDV